MNIVLVHGAFHGGWCWAETTAILQQLGARVFTPTLTGLADKKHLFSPSVNLATHVQDIVHLIDYENLGDCVLVGHSYVGNVISGVGDQLREQISHYIYMDASVPVNGSKTWGWASLMPSRHDEMMRVIKEQGHGMMIPPFPAEAFGVTKPEMVEWLNKKLTPMPRGCYTDPISLSNNGTEGLRRSYIAAANPAYDRMADTVDWISNDPDWTLQKIDTGHDMMLTEPEKTAKLIWALATDSVV